MEGVLVESPILSAVGISVIVLGAGPENRGERFAVDPDFRIAFAPPYLLRIPDGQGVADIDALAPRVEVVPVLARPCVQRILMTPIGVELHSAG